MLCANCPEASYRMEAVNRATVALLLLCAVIPSARTSCGGNCVSAREEDKSVATQQITVSCPQADRCGEVFLHLNCSGSAEITKVDIKGRLQGLSDELSALVNDTTSSQTAAQSLNGRLSTLEERVESLLHLVSSLPQQ